MSASSMRRGSITTSGVPASAAWRMRAPTTGWASVGLAPATTMSPARSMSDRLALAAPVPVAWVKPIAVEEWQTRAQQSTLLVPTSARKSFCSR